MKKGMPMASRGDLHVTESGRCAALEAFPFECVTSRLVDMPEKRLMLAVLLDAIGSEPGSGSV